MLWIARELLSLSSFYLFFPFKAIDAQAIATPLMILLIQTFKQENYMLTTAVTRGFTPVSWGWWREAGGRGEVMER